jgi:C_GCAxxG_C_C family probable redox protein
MGSLKEEAIKYIESENKYGDKKELYHYNCAETLLNASNDYFKLGVDLKFLRAIVPFGGGFYSERTCGALTGGIAALGLMFAEDKPTNNEKLKEITKRWVEAFEKEFSSIECKEIKPLHRDEIKGCEPVMSRAAELLEEVINKYKEENN